MAQQLHSKVPNTPQAHPDTQEHWPDFEMLSPEPLDWPEEDRTSMFIGQDLHAKYFSKQQEHYERDDIQWHAIERLIDSIHTTPISDWLQGHREGRNLGGVRIDAMVNDSHSNALASILEDMLARRRHAKKPVQEGKKRV